MKYWYLKDADIFGPAEPADIVKDLGEYTESALVCPEPHSADEDFWKEMSFYKEDFGSLLAAQQADNPALMPSSSIPHEDTPHAFEEAAQDFKHDEKKAEVKEEQAHEAEVKSIKSEVESEESPSVKAAVEEEKVLEELRSPEPLPVTEITEAPAGTVSDIEPEDESEGTLFIPKTSAKAVVMQKNDAVEQIQAVEGEPELEAKKTQIKPVEEDEVTAVFSEEAQIKTLAQEPLAEPPAEEKPQPVQEPLKKEEPKPEAAKAEQKITEPEQPSAEVKKADVELKPVEEINIKAEDIEETFSDVKTVRIVSAELQESPSIIDKAHTEPLPAAAKADSGEAQNNKEKSFFSSMKDEQPAAEEAVDNDSESPFPFADENSPIVEDDEINTDPFLEIESKLLVSDDADEDGQKTQKDGEDSKEEKMKKGEKIFTSIPTVSGKIISSYEAPPSKNKNDTVFILLAFMVFFVAVALFMAKFMDKSKQEQPAGALPQPGVEATQEEEKPQPLPVVSHKEYNPAQDTKPMIEVTDITESAAPAQKPKEDVKARAQEIVKKYLLDPKRGSVSEYFDATYGNDYQKRWNATALYGDTYVVEFVASKVRKEPIVYLFRVDTKRGIVTGGLNNITLDLLQN